MNNEPNIADLRSNPAAESIGTLEAFYEAARPRPTEIVVTPHQYAMLADSIRKKEDAEASPYQMQSIEAGSKFEIKRPSVTVTVRN
jgi:hypothetical protein